MLHADEKGLLVATQETILCIESRGVRLDVLAEDSEGRIFNIEVQKATTVDHARRIHLYSSLIDSDLLERGKPFNEIPTLVMIYISETNIWQFHGAMSRVVKVWKDNGKIFDDGLEIIGVNAAVDDGSKVAALMAYFKTADPTDETHGELSKKVKYLKAEGGLQMIIDTMDINYIEGLEEGKEQGINQEKAATALKLLQKNSYPLEEISEITGLSIARILQIKETLGH